jgi:peptidyl-tRNA hydrolase, PTH2 family
MERISKQVIVVRKDLKNSKGEKIRSGKMIAQGAHASMKALLDISDKSTNGEIRILLEEHTALHDWINGRFTKICVSVNSEEELVAIYEQAKAKGLICSLITDAGLTEFNNVPTKTCAAIGPCWSDEVDEITGKLPLL